MQVEMGLAELLINAIVHGRVPGVQFKRGWSDDRATFEGLKKVIENRLDGARRVAIEDALRQANDTHPALKTKADNERLRAVLRSLISSGSMHPISQALAMNTLEPGSGDEWLEKRTASDDS